MYPYDYSRINSINNTKADFVRNMFKYNDAWIINILAHYNFQRIYVTLHYNICVYIYISVSE